MTPERFDRLRHVCRQRQLDCTVILENVHDPHNISAVLRSCDSVGIQSVQVLYTESHLDEAHFRLGKKTSAGARKWVDAYVYRDIEKCFKEVRKRHERILVAAVHDTAQALHATDLTRPCAVLFGNEHDGVSERAMQLADGVLYIPQMGMVRSLNISVACAVVLYEMLRQRMEKGMYDEPFAKRDPRQALLDDFIVRHHDQHKGRQPKHAE